MAQGEAVSPSLLHLEPRIVGDLTKFDLGMTDWNDENSPSTANTSNPPEK